MPRYAFRCPQCELEFEVARRMTDDTTQADCPMDNAPAQRIFHAPQVNANRGSSSTPAVPNRPGGGFSHFGHSHGTGSGAHRH